MGLGLAGGACAAMRWLCCFKTSGQLVSWWTGGVEVTVTGAVTWCVWMCVGGIGWVGPWTEYKQKSEQVLKYEEREGESGAGRKYVCFTESECSRRGFLLCQTNNVNRCLTVRRKCGQSFRQCLTEPGMTLLFLSNYTSSFTTPAVIINNVLFLCYFHIILEGL